MLKQQLNERKFNMKNLDLEQNICDASASGRGYSSAPWNNYGNPSFNSKEILQNGRSMIEMLGVLAIIGVLSVGGIAGYSKAMQKYRVNKAIEQITLIAGNVRAFFGCPIIKKAKILPDEMLTVNDAGKITAITNPFGGWVRLGTMNKAKSGDNQAFEIEYYMLPQEVCIALATHDWSNAGAYAIYIEEAYLGKTPVDLNIATQYCDVNAEIWFYFDVDVNSTYWSEQMSEY